MKPAVHIQEYGSVRIEKRRLENALQDDLQDLRTRERAVKANIFQCLQSCDTFKPTSYKQVEIAKEMLGPKRPITISILIRALQSMHFDSLREHLLAIKTFKSSSWNVAWMKAFQRHLAKIRSEGEKNAKIRIRLLPKPSGIAHLELPFDPSLETQLDEWQEVALQIKLKKDETKPKIEELSSRAEELQEDVVEDLRSMGRSLEKVKSRDGEVFSVSCSSALEPPTSSTPPPVIPEDLEPPVAAKRLKGNEQVMTKLAEEFEPPSRPAPSGSAANVLTWKTVHKAFDKVMEEVPDFLSQRTVLRSEIESGNVLPTFEKLHQHMIQMGPTHVQYLHNLMLRAAPTSSTKVEFYKNPTKK